MGDVRLVDGLVGRLVGTAFGRVFAVEAPEPLLELIRPELPWSWSELPPDAGAERTWQLGEDPTGEAVAYMDDERIGIGPSPESLTRLMASNLELWVAEQAEGLVFVHAGVVVLDGRAILLPGRSHAGKSTLVGALVQAGATYFSDEYAPIDPAGLVHPYPRPARQRSDSPALGWSLTDPEPTTAGSEPVPIGLVATLRFDQQAGHRTRQVSAARAVLDALGNTVCATTRSQEALEVLSTAITPAQAMTGTRGDAVESVPTLIAALSTRAPAPA